MEQPPDLEARVTALEGRIEEVAADASAARHLAAAGDRDLADLGARVDAHREAINALGVQLGGRITGVESRLDGIDTRLDGIDTRLDGIDTRLDGIDTRLDGVDTRLDGVDTRLDGIDTRFDGVDVRLGGLEQQVGAGFAQIRGRLDATAAGQQTIVDMLTRLIDGPGDEQSLTYCPTRPEGLN